MRWLHVFTRRQKDADIEDEIHAHLALAAADRIESGANPEQARREARRELGSVSLVREDTRAVWHWRWYDALWSDLKLSLGNMRRSPGFTGISVAVLTIGIAATTAIFSLVNALYLRPLPVANGDRIVRLVQITPFGPQSQTSLPLAGALLRETGVFRDVSAHRLDLINLTGTPNPEQIPVARVSKDFFRLFGAHIVAGRTFTPTEDSPAGPRVAVLSHSLWVRQFDARAEVIGSGISLGNEPYVVIGVLAPDFDSEQFSPLPDVWVPLRLDPNTQDRGGEWCFVNAGLQPGATVDSANAQLSITLANLRRLYGRLPDRLVLGVRPVRDALVGNNLRASLRALEGAVGLVLLIACTNIASLLLVRGTARAREMAVRASIGAGRGRLIRQLLTESLVLAIGGAIGGVALGAIGIRLLLAHYPSRNPTLLGSDLFTTPRLGADGSGVSLDWRVVSFAIGASMMAMVLTSLWPALRASRVNLQLVLKQTGAGSVGNHHTRTRTLLVMGQVALAFILLVAAGLLIRTSLALRAVDPGFDAQHVLTMRMSVSGTPFEKRDGIERLTRTGLQRLSVIPGVTAASTACCMPLETVWQLPFIVQSRSSAGESPALAGWTFVSPSYFEVFRVPLIRGRDFTDRDDASAPGVVIINQEMARKFWPTGDPLDDSLMIGRGVRPDYNQDPVRRIVGIVGDVRDESLGRTPRPAMYVPVSQVPDGVTVLNVRLLPLVWLVRTGGAPSRLAPLVERELHAASAGLPVARMRTMEEVVDESTARARFNSLVMGLFAMSALLLAAVGIYGLIAYAVAQRLPEIGIRLALGATAKDVWRLIAAQGLRPVWGGIALGVAASFGLGQLLATLLFGVTPSDPRTLVTVVMIFIAVGLLAVSVPARRAIRTPPMNALRHE